MTDSPLYNQYTVHFDGGGSITFIASQFSFYYTGHHSNRCGKVFEVKDEWYHPISARIASIEEDRIATVTWRPFSG